MLNDYHTKEAKNYGGKGTKTINTNKLSTTEARDKDTKPTTTVTLVTSIKGNPAG